MAVEMGYSNVMVYMDGIPGWAKAGYPLVSNATYPSVDIPLISAEQLSQMDKEKVFLVDTRPKENFEQGHIEGSRNIDLEDIHEALPLLPKDKKIVLIDHKGKTTLVTGRYLTFKGYKQLTRLDGGFNAWAKTRNPIARSR
jgi:rhodanese-related sulfurtransferase